MNILSFDTTNSLASVAVASNSKLLSYNITSIASQQAESLFKLIKISLLDAKLKFSDIDLVSVSKGPGSFTGVRIGLAAAMGMQTSSKAQFIGLTNFQVLAYQAYPSDNKNIIVTIDAKREQYYQQIFDNNLLPIQEAQLISGQCSEENIINAKMLLSATDFFFKKKLYSDLEPVYVRCPDALVLHT
jgi:tRNA threonylcarbamoyladenosine biosynthesis protein TsaB